MRLLSLFGLDARLRRLRIAAAEGALAAEDRVQLLRMAWEDEKQRLKLMLVLVVAVLGLTTVAVALLSMAVVVHFWETPHRIAAAWSVAGVWVLLWLGAALGLFLTLRNASNSFMPARREFERDWAWVQDSFGLGKDPDQDEEAPRPGGPPRARNCSPAWIASANALPPCRAQARRGPPAQRLLPPRHRRPTNRRQRRHCALRGSTPWPPASPPRWPWW